jgi:predicted nucleic acid-binding protein
MRIYCDSVILIYYLEGSLPFKTRAATRLRALWAAGDLVASSDVVRLECRMLPIRWADATLLAQYDALFGQTNVQVIPITTAVFERATLIRAAHNFKLGDALHLGAAVESGCDRFLTNDHRLSSFTDITVEVLP